MQQPLILLMLRIFGLALQSAMPALSMHVRSKTWSSIYTWVVTQTLSVLTILQLDDVEYQVMRLLQKI